ncbi:MAG: DUF3520 domain-containing protein, partial [Lentisphaeraceae bacterium]|nr:DUF3520 domain-containing protein [Lentisphaeraceae bacterium]
KISLFSCAQKPRLALDYVSVQNNAHINKVVKSLNAVGATNLEDSIVEGYAHAMNHIKAKNYSRVILISDGIATVGENRAEKILAKIQQGREKGIGLTVIGMGENEVNDSFLETMADKGDGNYVFVDGSAEARKTFETKFAATFNTIAYNVKIQLQFDAAQVARYRLVGYDNRRLQNKDFRNDKVDAGEVGSGQSVSAIYELVLTGKKSDKPLAEVRLRYRDARDNQMKEFARQVSSQQIKTDFIKASASTRLAYLVGKFAEVLQEEGNSDGVTAAKIQNELIKLGQIQKLYNDVRELLDVVIKSK